MKIWMIASLIGLTALTTLKPVAHAQGYTVTDLGILSGAYECWPTAINNSGWVVGNSDQRKIPHYKGWLWTPTAPNAPTGSLRAMEPLSGWTYSWTNGVNNAGLCVGRSYAPLSGNTGMGEVATLWTSPGFAPANFNSLARSSSDPSLSNWLFSEAKTVSDAGSTSGEFTIVGYGRLVTDDASVNRTLAWRVSSDLTTILSVIELSGGIPFPSVEINHHDQSVATLKYVTSSGNIYHACLWDLAGGQATDLGTLNGGASSWARGLDDLGNVVGESNTLDATTNTVVRRGYIWTPSVANGTQGVMTALGTLGGTTSIASGVGQNPATNTGAVVGWAYTKRDSAEHACIWQKSSLTFSGPNAPVDLNTLKKAGATGLTLLEAYRINSSGSIIGSFSSSGAGRSYLLTPR